MQTNQYQSAGSLQTPSNFSFTANNMPPLSQLGNPQIPHISHQNVPFANGSNVPTAACPLIVPNHLSVPNTFTIPHNHSNSHFYQSTSNSANPLNPRSSYPSHSVLQSPNRIPTPFRISTGNQSNANRVTSNTVNCKTVTSVNEIPSFNGITYTNPGSNATGAVPYTVSSIHQNEVQNPAFSNPIGAATPSLINIDAVSKKRQRAGFDVE